MRKRIVGFVFVLLAAGFLIFRISITGAVVGSPASDFSNLIALLFFIVGGALILEERNYAKEILRRGAYVDKTDELRRIARRMGYTLAEGYREGTRVYDGERVLTVIPGHRKVEGRGTVRQILEALATGQPNFRKKHMH